MRAFRQWIAAIRSPGSFLAVTCLLLGPVMPGQAAAEVLDGLRWKSRVLLLFAADEKDRRVQAFERAVADAACRVRERDLVIGRVFADGDSRIGERPLDGDACGDLRDRFRVDTADFRVFLIGKDGGVKASYDEPPDLEAVFALIDGMPMRQSERRFGVDRCSDDVGR